LAYDSVEDHISIRITSADPIYYLARVETAGAISIAITCDAVQWAKLALEPAIKVITRLTGCALSKRTIYILDTGCTLIHIRATVSTCSSTDTAAPTKSITLRT